MDENDVDQPGQPDAPMMPQPDRPGMPERGKPGPGEDAAGPDELLDDMRRLRREARTARHAYWFPLILFGLLTVAALPLYVHVILPPERVLVIHRFPFGGFAANYYLGYYWLVALPAGLLATLLWYRRHARRSGVATPTRGYLIIVGVLTVVAAVLPPLSWLLRAPAVALPLLPLSLRGTFPFLIIAVGLWVLARAERSRALAVIALVYTGSALLASLYDTENVLFRLGWNPSSPFQWQLSTLPNVILPALILLVSGAGAFFVQRRRTTRGARATPAAPATEGAR